MPCGRGKIVHPNEQEASEQHLKRIKWQSNPKVSPKFPNNNMTADPNLIQQLKNVTCSQKRHRVSGLTVMNSHLYTNLAFAQLIFLELIIWTNPKHVSLVQQ